ncbi:MAG: ATP/GTP-binding protein [Candidatus Bathyarchaeia archaeon]
MFTVFIVGMAGSGKSLLTSSLKEWLKLKGQNVAVLNLDPGATLLPYAPDIDVRDLINIEDIMHNYELGPNGALIMAADLIVDYIETLKESIEEASPDILLVDTPGQIELFAFRESGPCITQNLSNEPKTVIYLFDAPFVKKPFNFISSMFMAAAVYTRLLQPQIYVLSKIDLISDEELNLITSWCEDFEFLEEALKETSVTQSLICKELIEGLAQTNLIQELIPTSAKINFGLIDVYGAITRICSGGEEPIP